MATKLNTDWGDGHGGGLHRGRNLLNTFLHIFWLLVIRTQKNGLIPHRFQSEEYFLRLTSSTRTASGVRRKGKKWNRTGHCDRDGRSLRVAFLCRCDHCCVGPGWGVRFEDWANSYVRVECFSTRWRIFFTYYSSNIGLLYQKCQQSHGKQFYYLSTSSVLSQVLINDKIRWSLYSKLQKLFYSSKWLLMCNKSEFWEFEHSRRQEPPAWHDWCSLCECSPVLCLTVIYS